MPKKMAKRRQKKSKQKKQGKKVRKSTRKTGGAKFKIKEINVRGIRSGGEEPWIQL
jgi:hypothetical protein